MFDDNAQKIWGKQYAMTENETILEGFKRVSGITKSEAVTTENLQDFIFKAHTEKKFCAGGRVLAGAGSEHKNVFNCVTGDTLIHLESGVVPIREAVGQQKIKTHDGQYRPAEIRSFGAQEVLEVELANGEIIKATADHMWITRLGKSRKKWGQARTTDLKGEFIPVTRGARPEKNQDYVTGVRHGIVYGDGTQYSEHKTLAVLFGEKRSLSRFFDSKDISEREYDGRPSVYVMRQPEHFKQIPQGVSASYWYGFFCGLLATDGNVDSKNGLVMLAQKDPTVLLALMQNFGLFGVVPSSLRLQNRQNPFDGSASHYHVLRIFRKTLQEDDFLREDQKKSFMANPVRIDRNIKVVDVRRTGEQAEVFCAIEPETHTMVIGSGYATHQCFVYSSDTQNLNNLDDVESLVLKVALTTKVGGGNGVNLDPLMSKRHAQIPEPATAYVYLPEDHPDHEKFYGFRYRDVGMSKGVEWLSEENHLKRKAVTLLREDPVSFIQGKTDVCLEFVPDSMRGIIESLFRGLRNHQQGRTVIYHFALLRPEGQEIRGSGGTSSGPHSFMIELFDNFIHWHNLGGVTAGPVAFARYVLAPVLRVVRQGGSRRGAGMGTLSIHHPDALDFLTCKDLDRETAEGDIGTFNLSFLITDDFYQAVKEEKDWPIVLAPVPGKYSYHPSTDERMIPCTNFKIPATWIWDQIAEHAWSTGEPGLIFTDTVNKLNPQKSILGDIKATNPCGEINLYPGEPCDLGAVNLAAYVKDGVFDWEAYREDVCSYTEFLDSLHDYCQNPTEDANRMSQYNRRLGLGVMGLHDALIKLGIRYGSPEAESFAFAVMRALAEDAVATSELLGRTLGVPEGLRLASEAGTIKPRRNIAVSTIAPTGTTSMLMGVSSGVEPYFSPFIWRKVGETYMAFLCEPLQEALSQYDAPVEFQLPTEDWDDRTLWDWDKVTEALQAGKGSIQQFEWIPAEIRRIFVFAQDVTPEEHVRMQAACQKGMDFEMSGNSISKTINMANDATVEDVKAAYTLGYELGLKGITVYRDGSRQFQVLNTSKEEQKEELVDLGDGLPAEPRAWLEAFENPEEPEEKEPYERPSVLSGETLQVKINDQKWYVTCNYDGGLKEVFVTAPKGDINLTTTANIIGRLLSVALQSGMPVEKALSGWLGQMDNTGGWMYGLDKPRSVGSAWDGIAQVILHSVERQFKPEIVSKAVLQVVAGEDLKPGPVTLVSGKAFSLPKLHKCDSCGNDTFDKKQCVCHTCGFSKC